MTFPTDEILKKATTLTSDVNALINQVWAARIETNLRRSAVFQDSAVVNTDLEVPNSGNTVFIPTLPDIAQAEALTEGTDMTVNKITGASSVPLTPTEFGHTIEISRAAMDQMKYDSAAAIIDRLAYAMSLRIEGNFAALWNSAVPGTATKMTPIYANNKATGTILSTDIFNDNLILSGVQALGQNNNVPFPDGFYRLYINWAQYTALMQDTNTRTDLRFGAPERLFTTEMGALHGCRVIVTNYIQTSLEGSGNTITVNNAMLVAPRWSAVAYKRRPQIITDPTLYDMGRRRRFGLYGVFDIEMLHADRGVVLKSA